MQCKVKRTLAKLCVVKVDKAHKLSTGKKINEDMVFSRIKINSTTTTLNLRIWTHFCHPSLNILYPSIPVSTEMAFGLIPTPSTATQLFDNNQSHLLLYCNACQKNLIQLIAARALINFSFSFRPVMVSLVLVTADCYFSLLFLYFVFTSWMYIPARNPYLS